MHAIVHHQISDPEGFLSIVQSDTKFPEGFEVLAFLPDVSHQTATCIWEAPSILALRDLAEPILNKTSNNTYLEIDESIAMGLERLKETVM